MAFLFLLVCFSGTREDLGRRSCVTSSVTLNTNLQSVARRVT